MVITPIVYSLTHEALVMPGMKPRCAFSRKQIRHMANLRRYPRGRPQTRQRLCPRTANFGFSLDCSIELVLAIS